MRGREFVRKALCLLAGATALLTCSGIARGWQSPPEQSDGWTVSGKVSDDAGPVKKVYVVTSGPQLVRNVKTDEQGRYTIEGKGPGLYSIRVQKRDDTGEARSRSLSLVNGARFEDIDFRIPKGAVISGRVLDERQQPVVGAIVTANVRSVRTGTVRLGEKSGDRTNDLGEYRIPRLPDGLYVIAVRTKVGSVRKRAPGAARAAQRGYPLLSLYPKERSLDSAISVEVRDGDERRGVDLVLDKIATRCIPFKIEAPAVNANEQISTYLQIEASVGAPWLRVAEGPVMFEEEYEACGLAPGEYRLHAYSYYTRTPAKSWGYGGAQVVVGKQDVELTSLVIMSGRELRGIVSVKDAKPGESVPAGLQFRLLLQKRDLMGGDRFSIAVEPSGAFVMEQVLVDEYGLRMDGLPDGYYVIGASQQGRDVMDGGVRPGSGDLKITLGADGATVRGRVLAAREKVVPDATVFLIPRGGGPAIVAQSDQNGTYQFTGGVRPGDYRMIALSGLYEPERWDGETAAKFAIRGVDVNLGAGSSRTLDLEVASAR